MARWTFPRRPMPRLTLAASAAVLALIVAHPAMGQEDSLHGTIVKDGTGVGGVEVSLHQVRRDTAGVIATTRTDPGGQFSFDLPQADPDREGFSVFFTTADHLGVRYFGPALHPDDPRAEYRLGVYDTTHAAPRPGDIQVDRRDVILLPDPSGGWEANEIIHVANRAEVTYVPVTGMPVWEMRIPEGASHFEVGEGSVRPDAVQRMGDRVLLVSAVTPGTRDVFIRYRIPPGGRLSIPVDGPTGAMNLFLRQPSPAFEVRGLEPRGEVGAEGDRFVRFAGENLEAGAVGVTWQSRRDSPLDARWAALIVGGIVLLIGGLVAVRRGRAV